MTHILLSTYNDMFLTLKQGNCNMGKSIAKPVYLLSLFDCIASFKLQENKIKFGDADLDERYEKYSSYYLNKTPISVPYFHLSSSSFYHLIWKGDFSHKSSMHTPSAKYLREHLHYAKLDEELWELVQDAGNREYFRRNIIARYLPNNNIVYHGEQV